ncbi:MAG: hypothetical protein J0L72_03915 [Armatimonadetes bacterium]|nr:hypothetical protein [Armatimonadota bacterium]
MSERCGKVSVGAIIVLVVMALVTAGLAYIHYVRLPQQYRDHERNHLKVFGSAVELRFQGQVGLTERVVNLSLAVAKDLRLPDSAIDRIERASHLRDIGLCAIPWKLVNESNPLMWSDSQRAAYDKHSEIGGAMLELVPTLRDLATIVRTHHAPFDGTKGPSFPAGTSIPFEARIIHVVDEYVTRERLQGATLARTYLVHHSGRKFDSGVVESLLRVLPQHEFSEEHELANIN